MKLKKNLGFGLGFRHCHYDTILNDRPAIDWFEILTENYLVPGGKILNYLQRIREHYPITMHGVSLSIGSTDPLDWTYLNQVKQLAKRFEPAWISDHLCWTGVHQQNTHDLLPLPYTEECLQHLCQRVEQVQHFLGQQILLENVSSYITFKQSEMTEWEFLKELAERADCLILLDINNIYVSAINHEFDPEIYLDHIPSERVGQIHLAGHSNRGDFMIDTHDHPICDPVWNLYQKTLTKIPHAAVTIERDDHIPELAELVNELNQARKIANIEINNE